MGSRMMITTYTEKLPQLPCEEYRIVFLTDLHDCPAETLAEQIKALRPDLILAGGDMVNGPRNEAVCGTDRAEQLLSALLSCAPVIGAMGNHETRLKHSPRRQDCYRESRSRLEQAGVRFLENASCALPGLEGRVRLYGLELPLSYYGFRRPKTGPELTKLLGERVPGETALLLAHTPEYRDAYRRWGADLVLAGHLHGGMIRLPLIGGLVGPSGRLFPRCSRGRFRCGETEMLVSSGLGDHGIMLRLGNPRELLLLRLVKG